MYTINKLRDILTQREIYQLSVLLLIFIVQAILQVMGIVSIMPFIALIMEPDMIFENEWLSTAYSLFNFNSVQSFIIATGVAMFLVIILSNAISAFSTWLKIKFAWQNNHRLSLLLLEKYLSMPSVFLNQHSSDLSKNILVKLNILPIAFASLLSLFAEEL